MALETLKLSKMNLAIHGLSGDIRQGNTYLEDTFDMQGQFDYVMANPPFNLKLKAQGVTQDMLNTDPRWSGYPAPLVSNANYAWIQHFLHHLSPNGEAGFVLSNGSLSTTMSSEYNIRKSLESSIHTDFYTENLFS